MKAASRRPLTTVIEQALLAPHTRAVLSKGLETLLDGASSTFQGMSRARAHMKLGGVVDSQRCMQDLRCLWSLFQRVGALDELRVAFKDYAKRAGVAIVAAGGNRVEASTGAVIVEDDTHGLESSSAYSGALASGNGGSESGGSGGDIELISGLLLLKDRLDNILRDVFSGMRGSSVVVAAFRASLKEAFEHIVNSEHASEVDNSCSDQTLFASSSSSSSSSQPLGVSGGSDRLAELMAKFADMHLCGEKGGRDGKSEVELDRLMMLFRFVLAKDVFEIFYKNHLAKRLILGKSRSRELERRMVSKLKEECGANSTNKLEGMFKDIDLSRDIMRSFLEDEQRQQQSEVSPCGAPFEMTVQVLTTGYWPTYPSTEVSLPPALDMRQSAFTEFYLAKYHGRRLAWKYMLASCVVLALFPKDPKEIEVSLCQTLVLLCFNQHHHHHRHHGDVLASSIGENDQEEPHGGEDGWLHIADIAERTKIDDGELKRALQSLACGGRCVLTKEPKSREVAHTDRFSFNASFTSKLSRLKLNSAQLMETSQEHSKTSESVARDRGYGIDAAIVRIMKARKRIAHSNLVGEVLAQLVFASSAADIKKRIESLIEREYLERDDKSTSIYKYLV